MSYEPGIKTRSISVIHFSGSGRSKNTKFIDLSGTFLKPSL